MRKAGITLDDLKKFVALNNLLIEFFGLHPRWKLDLLLFPDEEYEEKTSDTPAEGSDSIVNWPAHYRSATIGVKLSNILDRERHIDLMMHECVHLIIANLDDYVSEGMGKDGGTRVVIEETVSEVSNLLFESFVQLYEKELKALLT
jgi:hypothetical protein